MTAITRRIRLIPGERKYRICQHKDSVLDWTIDYGRMLEAAETLSTVSTSASNITVDSSSMLGQVAGLFLSGATRDGYVDITVTTSGSRTIAFRLYVDANDPTDSIW